MMELNNYIVDVDLCNGIIKLWNNSIDQYGVMTVYDLKVCLCDSRLELLYTDAKFGWTEKITTDDFITTIYKKKYSYSTTHQLNFKTPKELN